MDGEVVGYVMTRIEWGLGFIERMLTKRAHIISIAVLEGYRRRGIGRALMVEAMSASKYVYKAREMYLEVRISNIPAISLYEKLGFKKVKVIPFYYRDGEDAYVMARLL